MTYTLKSYVEERVPAWEECENVAFHHSSSCILAHNQNNDITHQTCLCGGDSHIKEACKVCSGEGGTWHDAVILKSGDDKAGIYVYRLKHKPITLMEEVTKSSFLVRRWGVCGECRGGKLIELKTYPSHHRPFYEDCTHCHKDADGKPTGAEKSTAGEWEVE